MNATRASLSIPLVAILATTAACVHFVDRQGVADDIAASGHLTPFSLSAPPFTLKGYRRITQPGQPVVVYIEGDGLAWLSPTTVSPDPTPTKPLALSLAAADSAPNVVYLARPCQYLGTETRICASRKYWTSHRFSAEVIGAFDAAFDQINPSGSGLHLVGYSGGGAVATLVAARRQDVLTLRTLAGNLDHALLYRLHDVSPTPDSLNPVDAASSLAHLPQLHLVGGRDDIVVPEILESYKRRLGSETCLTSSVIADATHEAGWREAWKVWSRRLPSCTGAGR
jgi:hypothetical protein